MDDTIVLTEWHIEQFRSNGGAITTATLDALGKSWPQPSGWLRKLVGTRITKEQFQLAVIGKDIFRAKTKKKKHGELILPFIPMSLRESPPEKPQKPFKSTVVVNHSQNTPPQLTISSNDFNDLVLQLQNLREDFEFLKEEIKSLKEFVHVDESSRELPDALN